MESPRLIPILVAVALAATLAPTTATAEGPLSGTCDETGLLACAGMDLGASVGCVVDAGGLASCSWTYGWITTAYSPAGLPGRENHTVDVTLSVCDAAGSCTASATRESTECSWGPLGACDDSQGPNPGSLERQLALGECVTVRVDLSGTIQADVRTAGKVVSEVAFSNAASEAGATCHVDNGR